MINHRNIKSYLDKRVCTPRFKHAYWLYEQQTAGNEPASSLNGHVTKCNRWATTKIGKVFPPITINFKYKTLCPLQRDKTCISNDIC